TILTADGSAPPHALSDLDVGRVVDLDVAPTGASLALANHRNDLLLVDLADDAADGDGAQPRLRQLDRSPFGRIDGMAWSFDSRWLAYGFATTGQTVAIKLAEIETGQTTQVTNPTLRDRSPAFDPEGNYLYFIGQRDYDPVYDELQFDLSFPKG